LEHNGDLYACDHFVEPAYRLGNIMETPLIDLVGSPAQADFGRAKGETLPAACQDCDVRFVCQGGCPKDRRVSPAGRNVLCEGYRAFFQHGGPAMRLMADAWRAGRPAAEVMSALAAEDVHGRRRREAGPTEGRR
jgi:uncharacterized protein